MRPILLTMLVAAVAALSSPFRVLVDRPGQWEVEWTGQGVGLETQPDGTVSFSLRGIPNSDVPGDLVAPRLQAVLALPVGGDWKLELVSDSSQLYPGNSWSRVPGVDRLSGRPMIVPARDRDGWSESKLEGFRLLRMDFPLVVPAAGGVRVRQHLRLRMTWEGAARLPAGSVWSRAVDNPRGVREQLFAPRRLAGGGSPGLGGVMLEVTVGDADPFGSAEDGLVRLTGAQIMKALGRAPGAGDALSNIAVYSGATDTLAVEMGDSLKKPGLHAIAIQRIDHKRDNLLDSDDEIRFWGRGSNLWKPVAGSALGWKYVVNPYARQRKFLVRLDAQVGSPELTAGPGGSNPVRYEKVGQPVWIGSPDKLKEAEIGNGSVSEANMGKSWYWIASEAEGAVMVPTGSLSLPGVGVEPILAQPVLVNSSWFGGEIDQIDSFGIRGQTGDWTQVDPLMGIWSGAGLVPGGPGFRFAFHGSKLAISGVQLRYQRNLATADSVVFPAPAMGAVDIRVTPDRDCWVLEEGIATRLCSDSAGHLRDEVVSEATWYAVFPKQANGIAVTLAAWSPSSQAHVVANVDAALHSDLLVVAPAALLDVAESYALHREAAFQLRPMKNPVILRAEDIYALWSGGSMDPVAVRDAIRWAHQNWGVSHVLLLGGGHADPRQVMGVTSEVLLPQWEDGPVATDDFFTFLTVGNPSLDRSSHISAVALGRVPARNLAEAQAWLEKLKRFEDPAQADFGPWRNTVALAADDVWQASQPDEIPNHTNQSEAISAAMEAERPWMRHEKLYLVTYPVNVSYQKPEAARDLQSILNRGVAGVNYMGHGGHTILADENLLDNAAVDRALVNGKRPFLFYAGSCTVGRNDMPGVKGLSEYLLVASDKGAMAAISGTRPSYPAGNLRLATQFWTRVTDTTATRTIGEVLLGSKINHPRTPDETIWGSYNNQDVYNILGDPAMVLLPGGVPVAVQAIKDTIAALSKLAVHGLAPGAMQFQARLEQQPKLDSADKASDNQPRQFFLAAPRQIISMQAAVVSDSMTTTLQMPARIAFGDSATLKVYAWDPKTRRDGGLTMAPRLLLGTAPGGSSDVEGPSIAIRPCDSSWSGGVAFSAIAQIPIPFCLSVDFEDTSGISSELGPDEGVVFAFPGQKEPWHPELRQNYDYRQASAQLLIDSTLMQPNNVYNFDVSGRDLMGNLSRRRLQIQPLARTDYSLYEVFNSPNPVREGENTAFFFKLASQPDTNGTVDPRVQASIRIHSISGKLVKVLRTDLALVTQPRPRAVWDLRDAFGNRVANGLYPYTVILRIPNESGTSTTELIRKGIVAIAR